MKSEHHILLLGAGVQSTTLYLWACDGKIKVDAAVFADTHAEPKPVYDHLQWLMSIGGPPIQLVDNGNLLEDFVGQKLTRLCGVPLYLSCVDGARISRGQLRRQCTHRYKILPIERFVRSAVLGLKKGQRVPPDVTVHNYYGISLDEAGRAFRVRNNSPRWVVCHFPLIDAGWSRRECIKFLQERVPHPVPKSACIFCPYRRVSEWRWLRDNSPEDFAEAVKIDAFLRNGWSGAKVLKADAFLHDSLKPLEELDLDADGRGQDDLPGFNVECMGMCGL